MNEVTRWYVCGVRGHEPEDCPACHKPVRWHNWRDVAADGRIVRCEVPSKQRKQAAA